MNTNTPTTPLLTWEAPARINPKRSARWYFVAGVLTLMLVAYALIDGSWTMAVTILLAAGVYFLLRDQEYKTHHIEISSLGVMIDGEEYGWAHWKSFTILTGHNLTQLHLTPAKGKRDFVVLIRTVDPYRVRDVLGQFLELDTEKRERIFDTISRFCKL